MKRASRAAVALAHLILRTALARLAPPPLLTVSQWADAERILPETSAEPGRWRTSRAPYLRGVMDAVSDPTVETIAFKKSAQIGGSEALINVLAYHAVYDPGPSLLVQPTIDMAETFSKDRLARAIEVTPALAARIHEGRGPASESTLRHKVFPGGFLALAGANSAPSLAQRAVRLLMCDDLDRFPVELENEGDPVDLAIKRTTTFWNRKVVLVSTPTIKGARIDTWYERSDRRRWFVPCPRCGNWDYLTWFNPDHMSIIFERRDPETAHLVCRACGSRVEEHERLPMVAGGEWRPTAASQDSGLIGFHAWEVLSPWSSLREIVAKGLAARERGRQAIRVWVNTTLGEGFEDDVQRVEPQGLLARREDYGPGVEVPAGVACLTAGVDTQDNGFWVLVVGWGANEEKWVIDWRWIAGDPKHAETKAALVQALGRKYRHALGVDLVIIQTCLDSAGHRTDEVYAVVQANEHRAFHPVATIGRAGLRGTPILGPRSPKRPERPVELQTVNVDGAKDTMLDDLRKDTPGAGYVHLPDQRDMIDQAFVAQLTSEHKLVQKHKKTGLVREEWIKLRDANHAWDAAVLAFAAYRRANPNISQNLEIIREAAARNAAAAGDGSALPASIPNPPPRPPVLERRVGRSTYLAQ
jgi:phage terminase large subunit GpA-like protein